MTELWIVIVAVAAANAILKGAGPAVVGGREFSPRMSAVISLLAPALLTALVIGEVFGNDGHLGLDERALGLGAAAIALGFGAPVLLAVAIAAGVTAMARLII